MNIRRKYHSSSYYRPCQTPTANFIKAGNRIKTMVPQTTFKVQEIQSGIHTPSLHEIVTVHGITTHVMLFCLFLHLLGRSLFRGDQVADEQAAVMHQKTGGKAIHHILQSGCIFKLLALFR
jgi:hypothetical protein